MLAILAFFAALVIRLLRLTWRVTVSGHQLDFSRGRHVYCFWHGRQAGLLAYPWPRGMAVLSSLSRDGELQARILGRLGLIVLRGSSSRGGAAGLRALVGAVRGGADAAFAVDGPRGPLQKVKPGAIQAAKQSGAQVVPITFFASRDWVFHRAWDRYHLPKPFARVAIVRAPPIPVGDVSLESATAELERALRDLHTTPAATAEPVLSSPA